MEGVFLGDHVPEVHDQPRQVFDPQLGTAVAYDPATATWSHLKHEAQLRQPVSRPNAFADRERLRHL